MLYSEIIAKAMRTCHRAHADQLDKGGMPYVFHPYRVAERQKTEAAVCAALLHDVVEDTPVTLRELAESGFSGEIIEALSLLTHRVDEDYFEYIRRIAENPIASAVKRADLADNMDLRRLSNPTPRDLRRVEKYRKALSMLEAGVD